MLGNVSSDFSQNPFDWKSPENTEKLWEKLETCVSANESCLTLYSWRIDFVKIVNRQQKYD